MRSSPLLVVFAALGAFLLPAPGARAAERFWNVGSGNWASFGNWNPQAVPGPSDHAIVSNGGLSRINTSAIGAVTAASAWNGGTIQIVNQGSLLVGTDLVLGRSSTHGTLNVLSTSSISFFSGGMTVVGSMRLGVLSGVGNVNQNAGTIIVGSDVILGDTRDSSSMFNPAGIYTLSENGYLRTTNLRVGANNSASGNFSLSGFAHLRVLENVDVGSSSGRGTFVQTGGRLEAPGSMFISAPAGGAGSSYTLSGGTFDSRLTWVSSRSTFTYTGGTVVPRFLHLSSDGRIVIAPGGGRVLPAVSVTFHDTTGALDVNDNTLELANVTTLAPLRDLLARGYNGGSWTGKGITSSAAAAVAAGGSPRRTALGYTFDPSTITIKYARAGDADLDGNVNLADFNRLASGFGSTNGFWFTGDFNYDGLVNLTDFNQLAANFGVSAAGPGVTPEDWAALASAVPEPGIAVPCLLAALAATQARRTRRG
jgi:hypothetical protein